MRVFFFTTGHERYWEEYYNFYRCCGIYWIISDIEDKRLIMDIEGARWLFIKLLRSNHFIIMKIFERIATKIIGKHFRYEEVWDKACVDGDMDIIEWLVEEPYRRHDLSQSHKEQLLHNGHYDVEKKLNSLLKLPIKTFAH